MSAYLISQPQGQRVPMLVSCPHVGIEFPSSVQNQYEPSVMQRPIDTDWFVDRLYQFTTNMGGTLIKANWSRYVIDLNRSDQLIPLYKDGRKLTDLIPTSTFDGQKLFKDGEKVSSDEKARRLNEYYYPYYKEINRQLYNFVDEFGFAFFFDAHSIRRNVSSIQKEPFPDIILGNNDGKTCDTVLLEKLKEVFNENEIEVTLNHPFKGGNLTRHFGSIHPKIQSLQLEMCQDLYMNENQFVFDIEKAENIQRILKKAFEVIDLYIKDKSR